MSMVYISHFVMVCPNEMIGAKALGSIYLGRGGGHTGRHPLGLFRKGKQNHRCFKKCCVPMK